MRHIVLAASLLLAGAALAPASAQYYYGPQYGPPAYGYDPYAPPRPIRVRPSTVCITARGPCPTTEVVPRGWPCGCIVPGFGYKRGNAG